MILIVRAWESIPEYGRGEGGWIRAGWSGVEHRKGN